MSKRDITIIRLFNDQAGLCARCNTKMTLTKINGKTATIDYILHKNKIGGVMAAVCCDCLFK